MAAPNRDLLTTSEVIAELLARPALRRRAATCVLTAVRFGNDWFYRRADLHAWLARQPEREPSCSQ